MILDAALDVFQRHGYEGASMDAIAAAAGVSKPVLYDCFAGKQELFTELLTREEERVMSQITAAIPATPDADDIEGVLTRGLAAFLRTVEESPRTYRVILLGEGGANAAVERRVRRGRRRLALALAVLVAPLIAGPRREERAELAGHAIVAIGEAGARMLLDGRGGWTPERVAQQLGPMMAKGLLALNGAAVDG
jgi:AcrR family transcriptional regulator